MRPKTRLIVLCLFALAIALIPLAALSIISFGTAAKAITAGLCSLPLLGMAGLHDLALQVTKALPSGASTVATDGIDLENSANAHHSGGFELLVQAPALVVGELADTETMKYDVYHDTAVGFGTEALLLRDVVVQTGAGGAGAAAQNVAVALPSHVSRYVRVKATNSAALDCSGKTLTVDVSVPIA